MKMRFPGARAVARCAAAVAVVALGSLAACGGHSDGIVGSHYKATVLVSDGAVAAPHTDPHLKNPWGIVFNPTAFVWVADNGTQVATLYDGNGVAQSLVVSIPAGSNGPANPTGIVFSGTQDFMITAGGKTGAAAFIFAGEGGTITAWSPAVSLTAALTEFDDGNGGAVYKGLALANNGTASFLYAADFHNNKVDMFDSTFKRVTPAGAFTDPALPAGFAPFGIQAIGSKIFVTYAKQDANAHDDVKGAGLGLVNVFDLNGRMLQRFATGGPLNAPWGIAQAPPNFGPFSNDVLIGNFGDGMINAYERNSGNLHGQLRQKDGSPIVQDGIWGLAFGNGINAQPVNTLFFAAGPNDEADGVYGRIDLQ